MNRKQYAALVVLALVAGLVGGVVSSWFLVSLPAFAQKPSTPAEVIRAEGFEVVDKNGQIRAALFLTDTGEPFLRFRDKNEKARADLFLTDTGGPFLELRDKNEKLRASLSLLGGQPALLLYDQDEKVIWQAP